MTRIFIFLTTIIITTAAYCTAQNLFGFNGFYSMNSISVDSMGMKRKIFAEPGFGGGVVYKHMELRNIIGFQAEANFDYVGFRIEPDDSTYYKQHMKYLTVPIMAHVDIGKYAVKAVFAIGTYGSFLIDHSKPRTNIDEIDSSIVSHIHSGSYKTFTYGLCAQAGIAFCTRYGIFEVVGRGSIGMSKMKDLGKLSLMNYMTSRQVAIGVSYLVPFGKGDKYFTKRERPEKEPKAKHRRKDEATQDQPSENHGTDAVKDADDADIPPEVEENWEERMEN